LPKFLYTVIGSEIIVIWISGWATYRIGNCGLGKTMNIRHIAFAEDQNIDVDLSEYGYDEVVAVAGGGCAV
jgi:hypothetical protein